MSDDRADSSEVNRAYASEKRGKNSKGGKGRGAGGQATACSNLPALPHSCNGAVAKLEQGQSRKQRQL